MPISENQQTKLEKTFRQGHGKVIRIKLEQLQAQQTAKCEILSVFPTKIKLKVFRVVLCVSLWVTLHSVCTT